MPGSPMEAKEHCNSAHCYSGVALNDSKSSLGWEHSLSVVWCCLLEEFLARNWDMILLYVYNRDDVFHIVHIVV